MNSTQYVKTILAVFFKAFKRMEDLRFSQQWLWRIKFSWQQPQEWDSMFLWNICKSVPDYRLSHSRRQWSSE